MMNTLLFIRWVIRNVFLAMQALIKAMEMFEFQFENEESSKEKSELICSVNCWSVEEFESAEMFKAIKTLWEKEPAIKECYNRRWDHKLKFTSYNLQVKFTSYNLQVTIKKLQLTNYN